MHTILPLLTHPATLATIGLVVLVAVASVLLSVEAAEADLMNRIDAVVKRRGAEVERQSLLSMFASFLRLIGEKVRGSALLSEADMLDLEATVASSGMHPGRFVSIFIGVKVLLLATLPLLAFIYLTIINLDMIYRVLGGGFGLVLGMLGPNIALTMMRKPYEKALRGGLPDALDLMVVCAEAGLGLETSVDRVASEMRPTNRPLAAEFAVLGQELRLMPDRAQALERMGERTRIDSFQRLGGTLAQTLRFGTPLSQALRTLAAEMRTERLTRFEERAARLPALLVLPLILFIMPSLFITLIGPSIIRLMASF